MDRLSLMPPLLLCLLALLAAASLAEGAAGKGPRVVVPGGPFHPFERVDLRILDVPEAARPNNPAEIRVDAEIAGPGGRTARVPGFAMHRTEAREVEGRIRFVPVGPWEWHVRYSPPAAGSYRGTAVVTLPGGRTRGEPFRFTVARPHRPPRGMVRLAKGNPEALAYDDGSAYIPVGQNLCWSGRDREAGDPRAIFGRWVRALAAQGANAIRLWLGAQWCFGLEGRRPYEYNEDAAALLDAVMDLCERNGIAAMMCVDHIRRIGPTYSPGAPNYRPDYPYDRRNGGPCDSEADFLALPAARAQFQAQLRYIVARWGASPAVMAWEFWNEMNCMERVTPADCTAWTDTMARYLRSIDPYRHLITNSLGSGVIWNDLWKLPSMDLVQYHDYGCQGENEGKSQVEVFAPVMDRLGRPRKPVLFSEVGLVDKDWGPNEVIRPDPNPDVVRDRKGYSFHEALWLPFFSGSAGSGMHWFWDTAVEGFDWYPQYRPLARFVSDIPLQRAPLPSVPARASVEGLRCFARGNAWGTVAWIWNSKDPWQRLVYDRKTPETIRSAEVVFPQAGPGRYRVSCIDPWTGRELHRETLTADGSALTVPLPSFTLDLAVKAVRLP